MASTTNQSEETSPVEQAGETLVLGKQIQQGQEAIDTSNLPGVVETTRPPVLSSNVTNRATTGDLVYSPRGVIQHYLLIEKSIVNL